MPKKCEWSADDRRVLKYQFRTELAKKTAPSEQDVQNRMRKSLELQRLVLSKLCHHKLSRSREAVVVSELKKMLKETQRRSDKLKKAKASRQAKAASDETLRKNTAGPTEERGAMSQVVR